MLIGALHGGGDIGDIATDLIAACALLTGCMTKTHVEIQRVAVLVPVECKEPTPVRPVKG